jgi:psiF repeat
MCRAPGTHFVFSAIEQLSQLYFPPEMWASRPERKRDFAGGAGRVSPQESNHREGEKSMTRISQKLLVVTVLSLAMNLGLSPRAAAQGPSQQDKMTTCNNLADKKSLKGDDRKNFMQDCLSKGGNQPVADMSQKDKMNACKNLADKRNLTGTDRKSFLRDCMNKANPK